VLKIIKKRKKKTSANIIKFVIFPGRPNATRCVPTICR